MNYTAAYCKHLKGADDDDEHIATDQQARVNGNLLRVICHGNVLKALIL